VELGYAEAKELLAELRNMTKTDNPEFSYLSSMISFAEDFETTVVDRFSDISLLIPFSFRNIEFIRS
jgi:hypothetical protein